MRYNEIKQLLEAKQLLEVKMSPSSLRQMASQIQGALAGFEFEMCVPNVQSEESGEGAEDFDADESITRYDWYRDINNFFLGEHNTHRDVERALDELGEKYSDWEYDAITSKLEEDFYDWFREEFYNDKFDEYLEDVDSDITDEDDREEKAKENIHADIAYALKYGHRDSDYEEYFNKFREEKEDEYREDLDIDEFFDEQGLDTMKDFYENYSRWITWPHYTTVRNSDLSSIADVANDFGHSIGKRTVGFEDYHGGQYMHTGAGDADMSYRVEPDSSIETDDTDDAGLEFVSPPLPIDEMISDLKNVIQWAKDTGCYTNSSTGLHMNISVPNFKLENLDYTKLALLLGDQHVLQQFSRESNTYCKSAFEKVKDKIVYQSSSMSSIESFKDKLRKGMSDRAGQLIHAAASDKYTSINVQDNRVEFRGPGDDYLNMDVDVIVNTLLRFVVALDAACDPEKYKRDYQKKLAKLIIGVESDVSTSVYGSTFDVFAEYVAGNLSVRQLKAQYKYAKEYTRPLADTAEKDFRVYLYNPRIQTKFWSEYAYARTESEAIMKVQQKWSVNERIGQQIAQAFGVNSVLEIPDDKFKVTLE